MKLLMEAGADARKGIYPHRDATSAAAIARDREYNDVSRSSRKKSGCAAKR